MTFFYGTDFCISVPSDGAYNPYVASASPGAVPEVYDIPIGMVNRVLYHEAHRRAEIIDKDYWYQSGVR
jgi:phosphatidylinositol N-acetylglucosaminyltransferase subunit P